ncbi:hypothetical protein PV369_27700, partial [Streptomyces scabiei]|uniref:hypothetical protein n=1 Tax=Streptomyces scabiei TaxID=1930 RepID=UPI0029A1979A
MPDQHGQQQARARVDGDERQADQQGQAEAAQQPPQAVRLLRRDRAGLVDVPLKTSTPPAHKPIVNPGGAASKKKKKK